MNRKWLYRQLISYVSIFLLVSTLLACMAFFLLSEMSQSASKQIDQLATERLLQVVDDSLEEIERLAIKEATDNTNIIRFYYGEGSSALEESKASETIRSWMVMYPIIDSVYLYRRIDGRVLTNTMPVSLTEFSDAEYVLQKQRTADPAKPWSDPRMYQAPTFQGRAEQVVSLTKPLPFSGGELGLLVVNVKTATLNAMLGPKEKSAGFVELFDTRGQTFHSEEASSKGKTLTEAVSAYTGWKIRSGVDTLHPFAFLKPYSFAIIGAAFLFVGAGVWWFVFIARRNYEPIGTIIDQLQSFTKRKNSAIQFQGAHELNMIGEAIDQLIRQSIHYERTHEEDLFYRKKLFFHEVLSGYRIIGSNEWRDEMVKLQMPPDAGHFRTVAIEIDRYAGFCLQYEMRDQHLLKFAMRNVMLELAAPIGDSVWIEWFDQHRLVMLLFGRAAEAEGLSDVLLNFRGWVQEHLAFTVTIGVGSAAASAEAISVSFEHAMESVKRKMFVGENQVIAMEQGDEIEDELSIHHYLPELRRIPLMYRLADAKWQESYNQLFDSLQQGNVSRDNAIIIINVLLNTFHREIQELSLDYQKGWEQLALPSMRAAFTTFESLNEVRQSFLHVLLAYEESIKELREAKQYAGIAEKIKDYIDEHYANPDLSLTLLGDVFGTSPKYVSHLFKEQLGIKFVDYLAIVRMEHAKRLLLTSDDAILDIALKTGYVHVVSFNRAFKKMTGLTPGGFRRGKEQQPNPSLSSGSRDYKINLT